MVVRLCRDGLVTLSLLVLDHLAQISCILPNSTNPDTYGFFAERRQGRHRRIVTIYPEGIWPYQAKLHKYHLLIKVSAADTKSLLTV